MRWICIFVVMKMSIDMCLVTSYDSPCEEDLIMKKVNALLKRWFVDATGAMALGLMASLVVGVYFQQLSNLPALSILKPIAEMAGAKSPIIGAAVGVAVAYTLKHRPLVIYANAVAGAVGYMAGGGLGGPVGAYVGAIVGAEVGGLIVGRTKLDIVLTPFVTILSGGLAGYLMGPVVGKLMASLGTVINGATTLQPILMGIVIAVIMGLAITSPISSAALAISLGLSGLAAGAATVGCCTHMVGYAVISYRDNGLDGFFAQAIGTSKLQLPNAIKKPAILLPVMAACAIVGPLSTTVFRMMNNKIGAGMGGSGFVGQINTFLEMSAFDSAGIVVAKIVLIQYLLPAVISFVVYHFLYKKGIIKDGDMKLPNI